MLRIALIMEISRNFLLFFFSFSQFGQVILATLVTNFKSLQKSDNTNEFPQKLYPTTDFTPRVLPNSAPLCGGAYILLNNAEYIFYHGIIVDVVASIIYLVFFLDKRRSIFWLNCTVTFLIRTE